MIEPSDAALKNYNVLHLHSQAEHFVAVASEEELAAAIGWAAERQLPVNILGGGSNVLLAPRIQGLVVHMATRGIEVLDDDGRFVSIRVAAGEDWHSLVAWCTRLGYHGLANLAWIPGTVGAAPIQNIGAYGVEVDRFIETVHVLEKSTGQVRALSKSECGFSYRESVFKRAAGEDFVVTSVDFRLDRNAEPEADYPTLRDELGTGPINHQRIFDAVIAVRRRRLPDPRLTPNVGSFFKNPSVSWNEAEILSMRWPEMPQYASADGQIKLSAGWMIAHLGWKGVDREQVGVDPGHALVLVSRGAKEVSEFLSFADEIVSSVETEFDITLEREPRLIGSLDLL